MVKDNFIKFSNNLKLSLDNFKLNDLKSLSLQEQQQLYSIFQKFDADDSKSIDTDAEILAIWHFVKEAASKNPLGAQDVLDNGELEYITQNLSSKKDQTISVGDISDLLRRIFAQHHSADEDAALDFMGGVLYAGQDKFQQQLDNDNWISDSYNFFKDIFNTQFSRKKVKAGIDSFSSYFAELQNSKDFKPDFKRITGVEFNIDNVKVTQQKAIKMAEYTAYTDAILGIKRMLNKALVNNPQNAFGDLEHSNGERALCEVFNQIGCLDITQLLKNVLEKYKDHPVFKKALAENGQLWFRKTNGKITGIYRDTPSGRR